VGKVEQLLADGVRNVRDCQFRQLEGFQVGPHDIRDSADLGSGPKVVHGSLLEAPALPKSFESNIHSNLVAEFEAVGNCLRRGVDLEGCAANRNSFPPKWRAAPGILTKRMGGDAVEILHKWSESVVLSNCTPFLKEVLKVSTLPRE
jgi:hypothetical protein